MKFLLLRAVAIWRRLRHGARQPERDLQHEARVTRLMRRANPFAPWHERANWLIDVAAWLRSEQRVSAPDTATGRKVRHRRARFLLDWLDAHRDERKVVHATLQKTVRDAMGTELFASTGMVREPGFIGEILAHCSRALLPSTPAERDLSGLFTAMFPDARDAEWIASLSPRTLARFWKLLADDGITHNCLRQIDESLVYLVTNVMAIGISPGLRQRQDSNLPLRTSPFMSLRRELEKYLAFPVHDDAALRSVKMLIAVCQAQADRIDEHAEQHGVSVGLLYNLERLRAQLARMNALIELRAAIISGAADTPEKARALLLQLAQSHHRHARLRGLLAEHLTLFSRRMVGQGRRGAIGRAAMTRVAWRRALQAGAIGGAVLAVTALVRLMLPQVALPSFFQALASTVDYLVTFALVGAIGGVIAGWQTSATAGLAGRMGALDTVDGLRAFQETAAAGMRAQTAAALGNLISIVPVVLALVAAFGVLLPGSLLDTYRAHDGLRNFSAVGMTPVYAVLTGVELWLGGVAASLAANWFALHRLRDTLPHHRRLVFALGVVRARRLASWLERGIGGMAGGVTLALLWGALPMVAALFGVDLETRHGVLMAGTLAADAIALGPHVFALPAFWLAFAGVLLALMLNIGTAFCCALAFGLHARSVPARTRRVVARVLLRRFANAPGAFLLPAEESPRARRLSALPPEPSEEGPRRVSGED